MPDSESPLELLKEVRKQKTQKELAQILGVDTKKISRWENGHVVPATIVGLALKDLLKTKVYRQLIVLI
jgi:DNA (cytosine-5)-methyltransferase 1